MAIIFSARASLFVAWWGNELATLLSTSVFREASSTKSVGDGVTHHGGVITFGLFVVVLLWMEHGGIASDVRTGHLFLDCIHISVTRGKNHVVLIILVENTVASYSGLLLRGPVQTQLAYLGHGHLHLRIQFEQNNLVNLADG